MIVVLKDILNERRELENLGNQIKDAKKKYGIDLMEKDLKNRQEMLQSLLVECVAAGETAEGSLRIVDKGRSIRRVNLNKIEDYQPGLLDLLISNNTATVPVGALEKYLRGYHTDEETAEIMSGLCDIEMQHRYEIVDILEG